MKEVMEIMSRISEIVRFYMLNDYVVLSTQINWPRERIPQYDLNERIESLCRAVTCH
jgi:hypothetical protein